MGSDVGALESPSATLGGSFGEAVDIGADFAVVGAVANAGRVYLYERPGPTNDFTYTLFIDRIADPERRFGYSVAIDGERLLVGAPENASNSTLDAERPTSAAGSCSCLPHPHRIQRKPRPRGRHNLRISGNRRDRPSRISRCPPTQLIPSSTRRAVS